MDRIATRWEASGNTLSSGIPFERLGTDRPALHLSAKQDWGVRRQFKLRELAEGRIWLERLAAQPDNSDIIARTIGLALKGNKTIASTSPPWPAPLSGSMPPMIAFNTRQ